MARPSKYKEALADELCEQLANGKSLLKICEQDGYPSQSMVYRWLDAQPIFREKYARAREQQADHYAAEIIDLADTCREGKKYKETKDGTFVETGDMVERSRLQIDARKWYASKLAPKKYGDKMAVEHDVSDSLADRIAKARQNVTTR